MIERWHYSYAGLRVTSQLPIPEWGSFGQSEPCGDAEVIISLESLPTSEVPISANEYHFHIPGVAYYGIRHGREITVTPEPNACAREVRLFLLGTAWSALCYQRDLLVLHASAVRVGQQAVAFCAPMGMGKSTLAACLVARGYAFVADDLTRFHISEHAPPTIYPSAPRLKLWRDALDALGWSHEALERDSLRAEKFHLPVLGPKGCRELLESIPLRAIYLLDWGEAIDIIRLSGRTALLRLLSSATFRGGVLEQIGKSGVYAQQCLELVRRVPVFQLTRPRDWPAMDPAMELLTAQFDDWTRQ